MVGKLAFNENERVLCFHGISLDRHMAVVQYLTFSCRPSDLRGQGLMLYCLCQL
jgi:hypothetical protein